MSVVPSEVGSDFPFDGHNLGHSDGHPKKSDPNPDANPDDTTDGPTDGTWLDGAWYVYENI